MADRSDLLRNNPAFWLLGGAVVATIAQVAAHARARRRARESKRRSTP